MRKNKLKLFKTARGLICLKRKYATQKEAKAALKKARGVGLKDHYKCGICGSWHLTSQRESERKARSKK